jgi:hypothetical protein
VVLVAEEAMDKKTKKALKTILDYLESEKSDYENRKPEDRKKHIYLSIKKVEKWLNDNR